MLLILNFYQRHLRKLPLLVFLFASLNGAAQTFTLSFQRATLATVFSQIEQQSDYRFLYTEELLARSVPVSFSVKNVSLDSVLHLSFLQQPLGYSIERKHIIVRKKIIEKPVPISRTLRGKVVNEQGEPVAGISLSIKQTSQMTSSDANGEFIFTNAPAKSILLITAAEIVPQEIDMGQTSYAHIVVHRNISVLDETFVVAYGTATKRSSTGTVTSVKKNEIDKQPVANILSVLSGRVAGLQVSQVSGAPGSAINLQLRGINSIANGNDPLIIVDGIPYPSQSLNGIIGGGAGTSTSSLNSLNPHDIESIEVLKDADATAIYGSRGANGVILINTVKGKGGKTSVTASLYNAWGRSSRKMKLLGTPDYITMRKEAFANDGTVPTNANAADLLLWDTTRYTDWQDIMLGGTMQSTDANINLRGGTANTQFAAGTGYHKETTVFPGNFNDRRITSNLSLTHSSTDKKFSILISAMFSSYRNTLPRSDLSSSITLAPNAPALYSPDGSLNWENGTWTNPLAQTRVQFESGTDNLVANLSLSYKVLKSLTFRFSGGFNQLDNEDIMITPKSSFNPASNSTSSAQFGNKKITTLIGEPQIEFNRQLKNSKLSILTGCTFQSSAQYFIYQRGTGYVTDELLHTLRGASAISILSEGSIDYRYMGVFGRVKYDIKNRYLFSATVRRDGSSRYGTENRYSNFGSLAVGWVFTDENFLKNGKVLSFGKIKASAGITGNDQIGDYKYLDLYTTYSNPYLSTTVFYPEQLFNPNYGWEKVAKLEASLELGLIKNRLLTTINYYHNTTSNQLVNYPLPSMTGFTSILQNIPALIRNTGLEIELQSKVIQRKRFRWDASFNITFPHNKLVSFQNLSSSSYATRYVIGEPLSIVKKYKYTGVDPLTGNHTFLDFNRDGQLTSSVDQQQIIFTGQRYFGGMQHTFTFGKWQFSCLVQFSRVPNAANYLYVFSRPGLLINQPTVVMDRWRKPGDITSIQKFSNTNSSSSTAFSNYRQSDAAYSDASFIRLKNAVVSYGLKTQNGKSVIDKCQVFLKGNNLFTISGYKGLDPETLSYLAPPIRLIAMGFQVTFK